MTGAGDLAAWLREQVQARLDAARIIGAGGFAPQRWDTEPPGQVNPDAIPQSDAVTAALGCDPEYICGWVQIVAYDKLNNEPDEAYGRDSETPVILVDNGRREFAHIIRNDPRDVIARCEAELGILDLHQPAEDIEDMGWLECRECGPNNDSSGVYARPCGGEEFYPCTTVRLLGTGYRHAEGYRPEWAP